MTLECLKDFLSRIWVLCSMHSLMKLWNRSENLTLKHFGVFKFGSCFNFEIHNHLFPLKTIFVNSDYSIRFQISLINICQYYWVKLDKLSIKKINTDWVDELFTETGMAEVNKLNLVIDRVDQEIIRLQILVNQSKWMKRVQGLRAILENELHFLEGQNRFRSHKGP